MAERDLKAHVRDFPTEHQWCRPTCPTDEGVLGAGVPLFLHASSPRVAWCLALGSPGSNDEKLTGKSHQDEYRWGVKEVGLGRQRWRTAVR